MDRVSSPTISSTSYRESRRVQRPRVSRIRGVSWHRARRGPGNVAREGQVVLKRASGARNNENPGQAGRRTPIGPTGLPEEMKAVMKSKTRHRKSFKWRKRADSSPVAKGRRAKIHGVRNPRKAKRAGGRGL